MELKKQDIGVWVKASEELPDKAGNYIVKYNSAHSETVGFYSDIREFVMGTDRVTKYVTHWLKPIKDVYVLTEDELEEFSNDVISNFIKSITK